MKFTAYCIHCRVVFLSKDKIYIFTWKLFVLGRKELSNSLQLDVAGAFIDRTNLCVTVELFDTQFTGEADTTAPFNGLAGSLFGNLRSIQFCHGSFLDEVAAFFLETGSVVSQKTSSFDFDSN